jgi:uncharacterized protein YqgV (UPF0045/DUF77 family)
MSTIKSKQDCTHVRTAQDVERKYAFGKTFSETRVLIDNNRDRMKFVEDGLRSEMNELGISLKTDTQEIVAQAKQELNASIDGVADSVADVETELQGKMDELETTLKSNTEEMVTQAKEELSTSFSNELTALSDELTTSITEVTESVTTLSSEVERKLDAEPAVFNGDKTITGSLRIKGDKSNNKANLLFGNSNSCYIGERPDGSMVLHADKIHFDASSGVSVDDKDIPVLDNGVWTPSLDVSAVSSYTTQQGWYSKIGQIVTVGFFVKANCNSGYDNVNIAIEGLPFTPILSASGGGMCSGVYVSAGFNFQCFVAEASEKITTRVQGCNNTTNGALQTSSSGCKYRSGGGEITLSGTISFMTNS